MKVQCVLCNKTEIKDENTFIVKRLRNHPLSTYMCSTCSTRIEENTKKRIAEGKMPYTSKPIEQEEW